jgi:hypothetical protein
MYRKTLNIENDATCHCCRPHPARRRTLNTPQSLAIMRAKLESDPVLAGFTLGAPGIQLTIDTWLP